MRTIYGVQSGKGCRSFGSVHGPPIGWLSLLKLRSYVSGGFDASGRWAVQFGTHDGIKFHAVVVGECWVSVDGMADPVKVKAGECFLLARGKPFCIASDLSAKPVGIRALLPPVYDGRIVTYNQGGEFLSIGGYFTLADDQADLLLKVLPPFIHIREESDRATLRWCVERMRQELLDPQPGDFIVAQQLATLVLVQALRLHLSEEQHDGVGWLFALSDKRMRAAINAIHAAPARRWTLRAMAEEAAMSRTTFAQKFKETVGLSPMDYLAHWRMALAAEKLTRSRESIASIALAVGYESEKSFSTAFKRVKGYAPREFSRRRNAELAS
jgi:AraC-like DNA-binding protein